MANKNSNNDLIAQALNINPLEVPTKERPPMVIDDRPHISALLDSDLETARNSILKLIETGTDSMDLLKQIAESTEHPRAFEVLSTLINTVLNANEKLIGLHKTAREIEDVPETNEGPDQVTNNLFVGTTEEALAMLRAKKQQNGNKENKQE